MKGRKGEEKKWKNGKTDIPVKIETSIGVEKQAFGHGKSPDVSETS